VLTVHPVDDAPTITGPGDVVIDEDTTTGPLGFIIGDVETSAENLTLRGFSSNPSLVPTNRIVFSGSTGGSNRTVTVSPAPNAYGSATITLVVSDGTNSAGASFLLTVNPVNDAPVFLPLSNCLATVGQWLFVTNRAIDVDQPAQSLKFELLSFPEGAALDTTNGILSWRPTRAQAGTTNLVVWSVADSGVPVMGATQNFTVTVSPLQPVTVAQISVEQNEVRLLVRGNAGLDYRLQGSEDLENWTDLLSTNAAVTPFTCTVTNAGGFARRFFRVLLGP
jgi:hypothetical protein